LGRVTEKLRVLAGGRRVIERERIPIAALPDRLQPVDAQAIGERRVGPALPVAPDIVARCCRQSKLELPINDIRLEHVARIPAEEVETGAIVALEGRARGEKLSVRELAERRQRKNQQEDAGGKKLKTVHRSRDETRWHARAPLSSSEARSCKRPRGNG